MQNSRDKILNALKAAGHEGRDSAMQFRLSSPTTDSFQMFAEKASAAGARVLEAVNLAEAARMIKDILEEEKAERIIASRESGIIDLLRALDPSIARQINIDQGSTDSQAGHEAVYAAQIGLTAAFCGVAETGSLVMVHSPGNDRLISHAPPVHIAIIYKNQICPDRYAAVRMVREAHQGMPPAVTFVTGVSRTADVAMQVVLGMHGPRRVYVIAVDGED